LRFVQSPDPDGANNPLPRPLTEYVYDSRDRLIRQIDPAPESGAASPVSQWFYDRAGQLTKTLDPLGRESSFQYDLLGRMTRSTGPDPDESGPQIAPSVDYVHDLAGNVRATTDSLGRTTAFSLDKLYRTVATIDPLASNNSLAGSTNSGEATISATTRRGSCSA
jgi:YD repeat-containing protein